MLEGSNYYNIVDVLHDTGQLVKQAVHIRKWTCAFI